ncbi:hypothetical protein SKP52_02765 [Sphingopyxis fribergensis]|uniref:Uncharacterized protein n=1 Tax=Sphingopyxis fribergensis TaxID=1515612 RepID=A0A0A7PE19_9SPHN|nr:hypothetical protein [Sphingopyxis fribergensis]AJA07483.1 hypothetical protein SKP52_02765 [Sphingopyxis fribergensis]
MDKGTITSPEAVKVTQADRELYLALGIFHTCTDQAVLEWGWADNSPEMQRIARHREQAEKRIVDWLRDLAEDCPPVIDKFMASAANSIERGDHIQENSDGDD